MAIVRIKPFTPFMSPFFKPVLDDWNEDWPEMRMTEGLDVFETDKEVVVKAAVPGIDPEKVQVTFENGVLHISAKEEEKKEERQKKKVVYRKERVTSFDYVCTLPRAVNVKKLTAEVENGILLVKAPIAAEAKSTSIPVTTKAKKK